MLWLTVGLALLCTILLAIVLFMASRRRGSSLRTPLAQLPRPERTNLAEEALTQMDQGVIVLNELGTPVLLNPVARKFLGLDDGKLPATLEHDAIAAVARRVLAGERSVAETVEPGTPERTGFLVQANAISDGVVLVLDDITEELTARRLRKQFVSNASHELKSPVAGIQSLAEAVRSAASDDPETAIRFAAKLEAETRRLSRLISELMDLSRLDEPGAVSRHSLDLSQLARKEVDGSLSEASSKGVKLIFDIEADIGTFGDESQLGQMIRNLLENAIRYTPEKGEVQLRLALQDDHIQLQVIDDGIGIPLKHQGRIFERFFRVDSGRDRESGGTGLGLAIVKHVAELHGGYVTVDSRVEEGSTFTVVLPSRRASDAGDSR